MRKHDPFTSFIRVVYYFHLDEFYSHSRKRGLSSDDFD
jgi:hypothetical protein